MTLLLGCNLQGGIRQYLLTLTLTTDYLGPAHAGDWIEGRCEMLRASKNLVFAQGLLQVEERIVARLNGIFKPTGEPNSHTALAKQFGLIATTESAE
jgi:acyl-coenzyme A thioesterase PaaI-like protein